jgi:hypothetical protein
LAHRGSKMGIFVKFCGEQFSEKRWPRRDFLTIKDLGIKEKLVGIKKAVVGITETFVTMNWNFL